MHRKTTENVDRRRINRGRRAMYQLKYTREIEKQRRTVIRDMENNRISMNT